MLRTHPREGLWERCFIKDEGRPLEVGFQEQAFKPPQAAQVKSLSW